MKIGENVYSSPAYFSTLKDSEHAAAKVAFDSLSVGEAQEVSLVRLFKFIVHYIFTMLSN